MRAYISWHRPYEDVAGAAYEGALAAFHESLAAAPAPGFLGSAAHRISATPWLGDRGGYEDWNLVEASWALDPLNQFAVVGGGRICGSICRTAGTACMSTGNGCAVAAPPNRRAVESRLRSRGCLGQDEMLWVSRDPASGRNASCADGSADWR